MTCFHSLWGTPKFSFKFSCSSWRGDGGRMCVPSAWSYVQTDATTPDIVGRINVWPVSNFAQQLTTACNRVCKRTQYVTSINVLNVGSFWPTRLRPSALGLMLVSQMTISSSGADPGFFLGGDALVSCSTSTLINHIVFFFDRIPVVLENRRSSQGRGRTPYTLPLDPPLVSYPRN